MAYQKDTRTPIKRPVRNGVGLRLYSSSKGRLIAIKALRRAGYRYFCEYRDASPTHPYGLSYGL